MCDLFAQTKETRDARVCYILDKLAFYIYLKVEFKRLLTDGNENDDDDANGRLEEWERRGGGAIFGTERTADVVVKVVIARSFLLPGTSASKATDIFLYDAFFFFLLFFFFSRDGGRMDAPGER